jgi:AcrR family transcriptional regulator
VIIVKNIEATNPQSRPRGRPRAFDRNEALFVAAETFRRLGYEGASIADLTAAMGITPQSLYAAFKSKAELYREAVAYHLDTEGALSAQILNEPGNVADVIAKLLLAAARGFARPDRPKGCMVSTAVLTCATENQEIANYVAGLRAETIAALQARLSSGIADGELRARADAAALARYLGAIIQGMSVQALDGASEDELAGIAAIAAAELQRHRA